MEQLIIKRNYFDFLEFLDELTYQVVYMDGNRGRYASTNTRALRTVMESKSFWKQFIAAFANAEEKQKFAEGLTDAMNLWFKRGDDRLLDDLVVFWSHGEVKPNRGELGGVMEDSEREAQIELGVVDR